MQYQTAPKTPRRSQANPALPTEGFLRLAQILGLRGQPAIFPVSRTTWLDGVRSGRYPKPLKIGARAVAWRADDIRKLLAQGAL